MPLYDILNSDCYSKLKSEFKVIPTAVETFKEEKVEFPEIFAW